ncbi:MAG: RNA recognition motif domain-containing protein [Acidobacteriota bacterium]
MPDVEKEAVISRKVFAGNLSFEITRDQLMETFGAVGPVLDVFLPLDRATGRQRGFAFVEFETEEDAARAIETLNGKELAGRPLRVNEARSKPPRVSPRGGGDFPPSFDPRNKPFKNKGSRRGIRGRKRGF